MENAVIIVHSPIGIVNRALKRLLDVVGSLVGTALFFLIYFPLALIIKFDSKGPVLFRQTRIGRDGQPFVCFKFRTMHVNAEAELDRLIDIDALAEPMFKLENDPRVTYIGRLLRRWSIDEIPQFWNVLRGDMSLVGPRPEESRLVAKYNSRQRQRLAVRPGLSGPMQIRGRGNLSMSKRLELELEYIENYSLRKDIAILLETLPAVLRGEGAR
ncbi:MAG: sugar transferase [Candidatus Promineifilaceae bacterium]